jgi:hypothetical protein
MPSFNHAADVLKQPTGIPLACVDGPEWLGLGIPYPGNRDHRGSAAGVAADGPMFYLLLFNLLLGALYFRTFSALASIVMMCMVSIPIEDG